MLSNFLRRKRINNYYKIVSASLHTQWQIMKSLFGSWATITILISIVDIILTSLIAFDYSTLDGADDIDTVVSYPQVFFNLD
jgi:hypothetical protein